MKSAFILLLALIALPALATDSMLSKARNITLPTLQYREMALKDILDDIQKKSVEVDPERIGVSFVVKVDDATANKKLTMTINTPTIERALNLLAAAAALYIQYDTSAIVVQKSERVAGEAEK